MLRLPFIGLGAGGIIAIVLAVIIVLIVGGYLIYLLLQNREPVKKEVKDKPIVEKKETPKVVEKKEISEVVIEEKPTETKPKVVVPETTKPQKEMLNYSFKSRLHLADSETANRYNDLKNHLLSYEGVTNNMSWKQETFVVKGKMVAKLRLQGKSLRVYFGLDPNDYVDTKYNLSDQSASKTHESTPSLLVVKGPRLLQYSLELVDDYMKANEIEVDETYKAKDYKEKPLTKEKLIKMDLIKTQKSVF